MPNYEGIVPEWMREMWGYKIDEEGNSETYFNMATPQMDIYKQMGNPTGTASVLTNPLIKVPYEQVSGESFPGGNMDLEIEGKDKRIEALMRQLPATNMLSKEMDEEGVGQGTANTQSRLSFGTGLGFYENNEDTRRMEMVRQGILNGETADKGTAADTKKGPSSQNRMRDLVDVVLRRAFREEKAKDSEKGGKPQSEAAIKAEEDKWVAQGFKNMEVPLQAQFRISSQFGPRTHPINGSASNHSGMDLAADGGSAVYAPNDGTVVFSGWDDVYGNKIIVDFGKGQKSMFGHLDSSKVKYGQRVRKGDSIGYVGSTGLSSGPHLHWETWDNDVPINPEQFLGG
jgi:murein DD-endopeptidase MepM/ murein hydrolase activator NlpD